MPSVHLVDHSRAHQTLSFVHSLLELKSQPLHDILRIRGHGTGRSTVFNIGPGDRMRPVLTGDMRHDEVLNPSILKPDGAIGKPAPQTRRKVLGLPEVVKRYGGGGHSEWAQDARCHEVFIAHPRYRGHELACGQVARVAI